MSSRLFQELREERGLAYSVYAWTTPYADAGLFSVYLATAKKDAARAMDAGDRRARRHRAPTLRPAELARAKAQVRAGLLMSLESPGGWAEFLARQLLAHGRHQDPRPNSSRGSTRSTSTRSAPPRGRLDRRAVRGRPMSVRRRLKRGGVTRDLDRPHRRAVGGLRAASTAATAASSNATAPTASSAPSRRRCGRPATPDWQADGEFVGGSEEDGGGRWNLGADRAARRGRSRAAPCASARRNTPFRHLGFFPDMAVPLGLDGERVRAAGRDVLNVFGYTGVGTLACAAARGERHPRRCVEEGGRRRRREPAAERAGRRADPLAGRRRAEVHAPRGPARPALRRHHPRPAEIRPRPRGRGLGTVPRPARAARRSRAACSTPDRAFLVLTVYAIRMSALAIAELAARGARRPWRHDHRGRNGDPRGSARAAAADRDLRPLAALGPEPPEPRDRRLGLRHRPADDLGAGEDLGDPRRRPAPPRGTASPDRTSSTTLAIGPSRLLRAEFATCAMNGSGSSRSPIRASSRWRSRAASCR